MKHYPCEKCGSKSRMSRHHILPKTWWHGYGGISHLCVNCHREIERRIAVTEKIYSGSKSCRYRLDPSEYREILINFIHEKMCVH